MDSTLETPAQPHPGGIDNHHGRLACQSCQRKKIKCSRTFPCEQCTRSSLQCVPSTRKARTRHAGKRAVDSELRNRISKLESLVESLSGEIPGGAEEEDVTSDTGTPEESKDPTSAVGKYIGSPFWSSLSMEVQALKEALEDEHSDEEADLTSPATAPVQSDNVAGYDLILCPPGIIYVMPGALTPPSPEVSAKLCEVFLANVECLLRLFYAPNLRALMTNENYKYLGHDHSSPAIKMLKAAIWFAATNSMKDPECLEVFQQPRSVMLPHFRRHVDVATSQADLMNTTDLTTVQALVTYIVSLRLTDTSRRVWTLTAILVRICRAMGLQHESVVRSPFERELRRRLWFGVRFIDTWVSVDRCTEPLIFPDGHSTPMPNNVNDEEFDESSTEIPNHTGLTGMSFALMSHTANEYSSRFIQSGDKTTGETWQQRFESAISFSKLLEERFTRHCDVTDPFQRTMKYVGNSMSNSMKLRAARPMQKHFSSNPPPVQSAFVLNLALQSLKSSEAMDTDPEVQRFRWMMWVPWHALAIALAGLCFHRDSDLAKEAWPLVERMYDRHSKNIADTRNGMLWRPVEKLYKKAAEFRDHGTTQDISPLNAQSSGQSPATRKQSTPRSDSSATAMSGIANKAAIYNTPPAATYNAAMIPTSFALDQPGNMGYNHNGLPYGGMPTGGVNFDSNFNFNDPLLGFGTNDVNWMDFEQIFEDISNPAVDPAMNVADTTWATAPMVPQQSLPPEMAWQNTTEASTGNVPQMLM